MAAAAHLVERGLPFLVLEAGDREAVVTLLPVARTNDERPSGGCCG